MLTLHHLRIGRSIFTVWQLEEIGVEFALNDYIGRDMARPAFKAALERAVE